MASDDFTGLPEPWTAIPVTVVMPTYNEIGSLESTCERVLSLPLPRLHLKVVDDNSPDGTGKLAEELAERANSGAADGSSKPDGRSGGQTADRIAADENQPRTEEPDTRDDLRGHPGRIQDDPPGFDDVAEPVLAH
jgi:glycosyltransferase involved in cell wall biosynthesis